jgi:glutathione S-transferase
MKLYDSIGPNPRMVRMFAAERGATMDLVKLDLLAGENRQQPYLQVNPGGTIPSLELDDGNVISEITAICEYLDEVTPGPSLIGATPLERAQTRMWTRRIDLNIVEPMVNGYRYSQGMKLFQTRMRCIPEAAPGLKLLAQEKLAWLDGLIEGRPFICGETITMADIMLFAFLDFGRQIRQPFNEELSTIPNWFARMAERASAAA